MELKIVNTEPSAGYELLDSGNGEKLERFGDYILARPDPQVLWNKANPEKWLQAQAVFERNGKTTSWNIKPDVPDRWQIDHGGLSFFIRPTSFKHTGLFPEQSPNWSWIKETIEKNKKINPSRKISALNLFGYTGGATLAAAKAGAEVVHVDGSKVAISWAKDNAMISGLADKPIRWILDDVKTFVLREIKRGNKYDVIIMDPPAFGHGPKKESWKIEDDFLSLLDSCKQILSMEPILFLINGYASGYSALGYKNSLNDLMSSFNGSIEAGELAIKESSGNGRLLPAGIFARWQGDFH